MTTQTAPLLTVWIPTPQEGAPTLNRLTRWHWTYRQRWVDMATVHVKAAQGEQKQHGLHLDKARLAITLYHCGTLPDTTNLSGVAKVCEDGLVRANVLTDDSPAHLVTEPITVVTVKRKARGIRLEVWAMEDGDGATV